MKTIFSKTTLFATLMALLLSSCMSENCPIDNTDLPVTGNDAALFVRVVDNPQTRNTAPVPPGTPLVLNEGNIYLVDAEGVIVHHFTIVSADGEITMLTPEKLEAGTIPRNLLNNGVLLPGVSSRVTEVVIVGNTPKDTHTGNVNGELIAGRLLNVTTQYNVENVNLFGRRSLPRAPNIEGVYVVEVHLSPTVARLELPSINGMGMIYSFVVEGMFINHYHQTASVDGVIPNINSAPNLRSHEGVEAFAYNAPGTSFTTASNNALFYWHETTDFYVDGLTVRPSNQRTNVFHPNLHGGGSYTMRDHVWGFQVFAKNYGETTAPATEAPQMVIRLNDIRLTDGRMIDEPRFITIGGLYRQENGNTVPITHIRASNVYHILGGIVFDETDLGEIPGENEISVEVVITLAVWSGGNVHQTLRQPNLPAMRQINVGTSGTLYLGAAHPAIGVLYQWQISTDDGDTWENIAGATERNHTIPAGTLVAPVYFRRVATLGSSVSFTNPVRINVVGEVDWTRTDAGALIAGIHWATRNLNSPGTFAAYPHSAGRHYQWGTLSGITHHWPATGTVTGMNSSTARVAWTAANDPCPGGWRVPTQAELQALGVGTWYANWNGTGVAGRVFPAGATAEQVTAAFPTAIFLPAAGDRSGTGTLSNVGTGRYLSNTPTTTSRASRLHFDSTTTDVTDSANNRARGGSVRCVH